MANSYIIGLVALTIAWKYFTIEAASANQWEEYKVVPDVIPSPPATTAKIQYSNVEVNLGNELTPTQTHNKPSVYWPTEENTYYALFMNDPDVPKEEGNEYQHWIVFNIPGTNISAGDVAFDYFGPAPPQKTGLHRYTFLIYKQNGLIPKEKFSDIMDANPTSRLSFRLADLLQRFDFKNPVAGNFFRSQYDDNVPRYTDLIENFGKKTLLNSQWYQLIFSRQNSEADDKTKMEEHRVVPDIISVPPEAQAKVKYGELEVTNGNELTPTQVHDKPTISWPTEEGAYYTLVMNDPDVPQHIAKEVQHWLVFNIPGNDITKGDIAFDYLGSGPPQNTGLHRYIFLIYKQSGLIPKDKFSDIKETSVESRRNYILNDLLQRFDLKEPVAGNFYRAQFDENVPKYYMERLKKFEKSTTANL